MEAAGPGQWKKDLLVRDFLPSRFAWRRLFAIVVFAAFFCNVLSLWLFPSFEALKQYDIWQSVCIQTFWERAKPLRDYTPFLNHPIFKKVFSGECFDLRVLFVTLFWIEFFVTFPLFRLSTLSLSGRLFVQPSPWPEQCISKSKGNIEIWPQNSLHFETIFLIPRCVHWNRLENYHQPAYIRPWKINLNDSFEFPRIVRLKFQQNSLVAFFFFGW